LDDVLRHHTADDRLETLPEVRSIHRDFPVNNRGNLVSTFATLFIYLPRGNRFRSLTARNQVSCVEM